MKKKPIKKTSEYNSERETRVLLEEMNQSIKIVAEQHGSIKQEITELRSTMENRFNLVEAALLDTNSSVKKIEQKLDAVTINHESRITKLEEKVHI